MLQATDYLASSEWNLSAAVGSFFADDEEDADDPAVGSSSHQTAPTPASPNYAGPRTLDGQPAPQSAFKASSSSKKPVKKTGLATLSSLSAAHDHDEEEEDDEDDEEADRKGPRDLFAGGEKSGLAVQDPARGNSNRDPQNVIKDILAQAKAYVLCHFNASNTIVTNELLLLVTLSAPPLAKLAPPTQLDLPISVATAPPSAARVLSHARFEVQISVESFPERIFLSSHELSTSGVMGSRSKMVRCAATPTLSTPRICR